MNVIWSPLAVDQLGEFAEYIALDKPSVALDWAEQMFESVFRLADFPLSGKVVPEIGRDDIREIINGNYRIIYRITEKEILILTVRHQRQLFHKEDIDK